MKKIKCLSLLLALVLVLGMLPVGATAAGTAPVTVTTKFTSGASYYSPSTCEIAFSINDTAEDNITIDVMKALLSALPEDDYMPTSQLKVIVSITNNSHNSFKYQNNGLQVGTHSYAEESNLTGFVGYDGYELPLSRISNIATGHPAIVELLGENISSSDTDLALLLTLYDCLKKTEYDNLSDYILNYYRDKYKGPTLTWDDLQKGTYRKQLVSDFNQARFNAGFEQTEANKEALKGNPLEKYAHYLGNSYIQIKWPEQELAALSYNFFYQEYLSLVFGDEIVNIHTGKRDHGVGDYLNTSDNPYTEANDYLISNIGEKGQIASGDTESFNLSITLEGGLGNPYGGYEFDGLFNMTLQFVRTTTSISVEKEWEDEDDHDGIRPQSVSVQLYADGKPSGDPVQLNKENHWKHTFENLSKYSADKEITYTVNEVEVPDEYTATVEGSAAQGFVITNSHELRPVVTPTQPPVETPTKAPVVTPTPATPTATPPQTGDNANVQLWFALACLSLAAMAVAITKSRARRKG